MTRGQRLAALAAGALVTALAGSGCGRGQEPDMVNGKTLYAEKCGSCHVLGRAGTKGVQGPNLDEAFGPSRGDGLGEATVAGVVERQIDNVRRNSKMPEDLVTGKDTGALANAGGPKVSSKPIAANGGQLKIDADPTGALAFVTSKATAKPGSLKLLSVNKASIPHNIALRDEGGKLLAEGPDVTGGGSSKVSASVKAGKYAFVCTVPGHEEGGMKGELTVK